MKYNYYYDCKVFFDDGIEPNFDELSLKEYLEKKYEDLLKMRGKFILDDESEWKEERFVPVILSKKQPRDKYCLSNKELAKEIDERQHNRGPLSCEEIERILNNNCIIENKLGSYYHKGCELRLEKYPFHCFFNDTDECAKPFIMIYYEQVDYKSEEGCAALCNCLAHEYFHFYHDLMAGTEYNKKPPGLAGAYRKRVVESLADFFALVYSIAKKERDYPIGIYNKWVERFGSNWPYAFAYCYFFNEHGYPVPYSDDIIDYCLNKNGCQKKFNKVFRKSATSMTDAHKELISGAML